jgi:hypothetical protein
MIDPFDLLRDELVRAARRAHAQPGRSPLAWLRRRNHPIAIIVAALVLTGTATAAVVSLAGKSSQPLVGTLPGKPSSSAPFSLAGKQYRIVVTPVLAAGSAGWNSFTSLSFHGRFSSGGGGGGGYPTNQMPVFGGGGSPNMSGQAEQKVEYLLVGPQVGAIRVGKNTIKVRRARTLPVGDGAAVFFAPANAPDAGVIGAFGDTAQQLRQHLRITLIGWDGNPITISGRLGGSAERPRFWQTHPNSRNCRQITRDRAGHFHSRPCSSAGIPRRPLQGACQLVQHGLPALTPEWGNVVTYIAPIPNAVGEVFSSCVNTTYYLHGWPLAAALLLDAQNPEHTLGPLPGAQKVAGHPNLVEVPTHGWGDITARRVGNAWLVVQGGYTTGQRLEVLNALDARIVGPVH